MSASHSDRQISKVGGRVDHDDDDEDKHGGGSSGRDSVHVKKKNTRKKKEKKQRSGYGCDGDFAKSKKVALLQFTMAKKYLKHRRENSNKWPSSSSANATTTTGKRIVGSCFCLKQPFTLESPAESHTSDPNDPKFTFEMLKTLIEKNDFYSIECDPHLDATPLSSSNKNYG